MSVIALMLMQVDTMSIKVICMGWCQGIKRKVQWKYLPKEWIVPVIMRGISEWASYERNQPQSSEFWMCDVITINLLLHHISYVPWADLIYSGPASSLAALQIASSEQSTKFKNFAKVNLDPYHFFAFAKSRATVIIIVIVIIILIGFLLASFFIMILVKLIFLSGVHHMSSLSKVTITTSVVAHSRLCFRTLAVQMVHAVFKTISMLFAILVCLCAYFAIECHCNFDVQVFMKRGDERAWVKVLEWDGFIVTDSNKQDSQAALLDSHLLLDNMY